MINVPALVSEAKARKIKGYPQHVNRASSIGHPCTRYLTYSRTHWQEKKLHDVGLQYVFDLGNLYEAAFLQDLREAGLSIEEQQTPFFDKEYQLSGHIDGKLPLNGRRIPIEAKSMAPYTWDTINSIEDVRHAKAHYVRGYEGQVLCYLYFHKEETGLMFFINKVSGKIKQIEVPFDQGRMDEILQKCTAINEHVAAETLPEKIDWDEGACGRCGFLHICYPDKDFGPGLEALDDVELESMLEQRAGLVESYKTYQEIDEAIKEAVKGKNLLIGSWEITGKWVDRKGYMVKDSRYWLPRFKHL